MRRPFAFPYGIYAIQTQQATMLPGRNPGGTVVFSAFVAPNFFAFYVVSWRLHLAASVEKAAAGGRHSARGEAFISCLRRGGTGRGIMLLSCYDGGDVTRLTWRNGGRLFYFRCLSCRL